MVIRLATGDGNVKILELVREMCDLQSSGEFVPILEADVAGCLYHLIVTRNLFPLCCVHLDTRVLGAPKDRFDLAIGSIRQPDNGRPTVDPEAIVEIKMFPNGFTDQQHRVHLGHILDDDLRKLGSLKKAANRVEFVFDEVNYLSGTYGGLNRENAIIAKRNEVAQGVGLILARRIRGDWQVSLK